MDDALQTPLIIHAVAVIRARDIYKEALAQAETVYKDALRHADKAYREQVKLEKAVKAPSPTNEPLI